MLQNTRPSLSSTPGKNMKVKLDRSFLEDEDYVANGGGISD